MHFHQKSYSSFYFNFFVVFTKNEDILSIYSSSTQAIGDEVKGSMDDDEKEIIVCMNNNSFFIRTYFTCRRNRDDEAKTIQKFAYEKNVY